MPNLYVALIHYPVVNKSGDVITSAITNLDLHDLSRATKTYGAKAFYVVTPLKDQITLANRIIDHWTRGAGAHYNPIRCKALELIQIKQTIAEVSNHIHRREHSYPKTVVTCAKKYPSSISYEKMRGLLADENPFLLAFGTAWGLAEETITAADYILEPVVGNTNYNHLSVRSAAAIILDRLIGTNISEE
jgi:hypothetical protein